MKSFLSIVVCLCAIGYLVHFNEAAAVVGIDFGSEFVKSVLIKPGSPFTIVEDETSKRKFPAVVAFDEGHRIFGNAATSFTSKNPELSFAFLRDLLGKPFGCESQKTLEKEHFPYKFVQIPGRNTIGLEIPFIGKDPEVYTVEELVAMIMRYAQKLASESASDGLPIPVTVKDAVLTVPSYFSSQQREAMLDSAKIAGLNVLSLIDENTASAIQFGIDRSYENTSSIVCFYNMGSTSTSASIVQYSSYVKHLTKRSNKTVSQLEVLGTGFSENLGGKSFDAKILNKLAGEFQSFLDDKGENIKVLDNPRMMSRLRQSSKKVKEILSANKDHPIYVESLHGDFDFKYFLTRDEFLEISNDLFEKVTESIERALESAGLHIADIDSFILVGGGMRIPKIRSILQEFTGYQELNQNLNADEAFAFGASLRAANQSLAFRVRNFGLIDRFSYPIGIRISDLEPSDSSNNEEGPWSKRASLFSANSVKGNKRRKSIQFSHSSDVIVNAVHDPSEATIFPADFMTDFKHFNVTGVKDAIKSVGDKGGTIIGDTKIGLSFQLTDSGILELVSAKLVAEAEYPVEKKKQKEVIVTTEEESTGGETDKTTESTDGETAESVEEESTSTIRKVQLPLKVESGPSLDSSTVKTIGDVEFEKSLKMLETHDEADSFYTRLAFASNELEGHIYSFRSKINYDDEIIAATTESQRESILESLEAAEDWFYENGEPETPEKYENKLAELKKISGPIELRAKEMTERPKAVEMALGYFKEINASFAGTLKWLPDEDKDNMFEKMLDVSSWLDEKSSEQEEKEAHEEPAFTSVELLKKMENIFRLHQRLSTKRKPVPKVEKNVTDSDTNTSAPTNETADDSNNSADPFASPEDPIASEFDPETSAKDEL